MKKSIPVFILMYVFVLQLQGQEKGVFAPFVIENGDTMPILVMKDFFVTKEMDAEEKLRQNQFSKLIRDLRVTMPYARDFALKMKEINDNTSTMSRREKRRYLKERQEALKTEYESKLKDLNTRQGNILIKLIDRETGKTSYSLIKEYKTGFTAFIWQSTASMFGMNLREKYIKEDEPQIEYGLSVLGYQ